MINKKVMLLFFSLLGLLMILLFTGGFFTQEEHVKREKFIKYVKDIKVSTKEKTASLSKEDVSSKKLTLDAVRALRSAKSTDCLCETAITLPKEHIVISFNKTYKVTLLDKKKIDVKTITLFHQKGALKLLVNEKISFSLKNKAFTHANDEVKERLN